MSLKQKAAMWELGNCGDIMNMASNSGINSRALGLSKATSKQGEQSGNRGSY
jgi:hypothetical protein